MVLIINGSTWNKISGSPDRGLIVLLHYMGISWMIHHLSGMTTCENKINTMRLTHWGLVTHICVSKLTIIGSDNSLSPGRRQAIIWTNAGLLLIEPLGTNFSEILIEIWTFSFKKMHFKVSSVKRQPFCLGLNVLKTPLVPEWLG